MKEKNTLNEVFIPFYEVPGYIGFYHNSDGSKRWISSQSEIDDINHNNDYFLSLLKRKGLAANYCFKHKIGYKQNTDPSSYKTNFDFICADAWYCSNYFYITNLPGFPNKKVAFNLRVSDHPLRPTSWFNFGGGEKEKHFKQFVLNILIDPKVNNINFDDSYNKKIGLTIINATYNPERPNKEIDDFINKVVNGNQVTYDYTTILKMFSQVDIKNFGNIYNPINFYDRPNPTNQKENDNNIENKPKPQLTKIKKSWFEDATFSGSTEIVDNVNGFDYKIAKPKIVNIKGVEYYQIKVNDDYYVMTDDGSEVRKRRMQRGELTPDRLSEPITTENIIKITEEDIKYMIIESLRRLKKSLN